MSQKLSLKEERAILISYGCNEKEISEYFIITHDMRSPSFKLEHWKELNSVFIEETMNLLRTESVSMSRKLKRFLIDSDKWQKIKLKRRRSISDSRQKSYFFIKSRPTTTISLLLKFLIDDLNIPLSDATKIINELKEVHISGYEFTFNEFKRKGNRTGIDGIQIEIIPNSRIIDFSGNYVNIGETLLTDKEFCLALLPLLAKSTEEHTDLAEYAQNIYTSYLGLKYGDN